MSDLPRSVRLYDRVILGHPRAVLLVLALVLLGLGVQIHRLRLDASADALVLEHDADLEYHREIVKRYRTPDFLFVTYSPTGDLFADDSLDDLRRLRDDLRALPGIATVTSMLDVPLFRSPPVTLKEVKEGIRYLEDADTDRELARTEFTTSPIYRELLVSADGRSTAIQLALPDDDEYVRLRERRDALRERRRSGALTAEDTAELADVTRAYDARQDVLRAKRRSDIAAVRTVLAAHRDGSATIRLGGVPMITDDMISFIRSDLRVFGSAMALLLVMTLGAIFRRRCWVILPMLSCLASAVAALGLVSICGWRVTVISANFVSLQLVLTMSIAIHLIVRFNELLRADPDRPHRELVRATVAAVFRPCLYAVLTTVAGFASLLMCDILPVINFGWMMTLGLFVSLAITFVLFPAGLLIMGKPESPPDHLTGERVTAALARIADRRRPLIFCIAAALAVTTGIGLSRVDVENSFIDYFRKSTEIYQGMQFIDNHLGGTTPLDVVIDFPATATTPAEPPPAEGGDEFDEFDAFDAFDEPEDSEDDDPATYWFTAAKVERIHQVHAYLDGRPEIGKVLSLHTMTSLAAQLNGGKRLDSFELALLFNELPAEFRAIIVDPYVAVADNQARLMLRVKDSQPGLRRDALLREIRRGVAAAAGDDGGAETHVAGVMAMYNNMLQSLFHSQILTIGVTLGILALMFLLLLRSLKLAALAVLPNVLSALSVLGFMGLCGIPLDMMTITIVAISVGIAVDDTIHYLHRFGQEFAATGCYRTTMQRCHGSIGNAMYYTSVTIILGFSILVLSNFIPSVLFGLLTALAMAMALIGSLTLLPALITATSAYGPARVADNADAG
jgi:predicted RND superfamily exporter protein